MLMVLVRCVHLVSEHEDKDCWKEIFDVFYLIIPPTFLLQ